MPAVTIPQLSVRNRLKAVLDRLYTDFDRVDSAADPVHIVRRYADPADREVVAFCAAALAFGRVTSVLNSIEAVLASMGDSPSSFVRSFEPHRDGVVLRQLGHRWIRGVDLVALLWILSRMLETAGSIEGFFLKGYAADAADLGGALDSFSARARATELTTVDSAESHGPGVAYFFPRPSSGSSCKRLNLFLRWMVRRDAIDLGVWSRLPASKLVVPLDTHLARVSQCLHLTHYRSPGWRMAAEITTSLRTLDSADPIKYDFSLCHLGMLNACGFNRPQRDERCPLRGVCRPAARRQRVSPAPSGSR